MKIESNIDYYSVDALNSSKLKDLKVSPKHFWEKHINPLRIIEEPTEAMKLGTAVHMCLFEHSRFIQEYVVAPIGPVPPICDKRTKEGKEIYAKWNEEIGFPWEVENQQFWIENITKIALSTEQMQLIKSIRNGVLNKKASRFLLQEGLAESEYYWNDSITGLKCKAKRDWVIPPCERFINGALIDLKTTVNASRDEFMKTIFKYSYYNQMAFYAESMKEEFNTKDYPTPILIPAEKVAPFECAFYALDEDTLQIGLRENRKLINLYDKCLNDNRYPGYEDKIEMIGLPAWAINKFNFEEQIV